MSDSMLEVFCHAGYISHEAGEDWCAVYANDGTMVLFHDKEVQFYSRPPSDDDSSFYYWDVVDESDECSENDKLQVNLVRVTKSIQHQGPVIKPGGFGTSVINARLNHRKDRMQKCNGSDEDTAVKDKDANAPVSPQSSSWASFFRNDDLEDDDEGLDEDELD